MAAGFVLPTIVMVSLVVVLVTTAVMIRSFDRSKNASNFRANEAVLNAAAPALDRARAKITRLFSADETNLPLGTPDDTAIRNTLESNIFNYTFKDEDNLTLSLAGRPELKTAWRYPVDTNNNGKFDSYTLYGIYYNSPLKTDGTADARLPLDARANPMDDGQSSSCNSGSSTVGSWVKTGSGALKKAFFTYVATVPISKEQATAAGSNYELFVGNQGFSALEMQQDQVRINLDNNAVFYQDDLEITFAPKFFINGRVHTNGNLLVSAFATGQELVFLQVSSPFSCFYQKENSEINVAGNVAAGGIFENTDGKEDLVQVHLFRGKQNDPTVIPNLSGTPAKNPKSPSINGNNKTTDKLGGQEVAYNDRAYQTRLGVLIGGALSLFPTDTEQATPDQVKAITRFPQDVIDSFKQKYNPNALQPTLLRNVLQSYFEGRLRRVPFAEVPINSSANSAITIGSSIASGNSAEARAGYQFIFTLSPDDTTDNNSSLKVITPPKNWMLIEDLGSGATASYTKLNLKYLSSVDPKKVPTLTSQNDYIGDRVLVGNNLPYRWFNTDTKGLGIPSTQPKKFAKPSSERPILPTNTIKWLDHSDDDNPDTLGGATRDRSRNSRIVILDDIADTSRGGFWETSAATNQAKISTTQADGTIVDTFTTDDVRGGLRVITGSGLYIDGCPTVAPASGFPTGFPCNGAKGLGMRASDPKTTLSDTRSFLPSPPQFQEDSTGDYRLSLSPPYAADPVSATPTSTPTTAQLPAGEERVRVKLPVPDSALTLISGEKPITVWSDAMPMWQDRNLDGKWDISGWNSSALTEAVIKTLDLKGDLQMRASVIYHYKSTTPELPIACVASYYDPSNKNSANASDGLALTNDRRANSRAATPSPAGTIATATNGRSYDFVSAWRTPAGDDLTILQRQAAMVFPDGRLVNEPLRTALQKVATSGNVGRNITDNAAIDAAMCSLKILDGTASASATAVPHGAIKEATMVDGRQVKGIHKLMVGATDSIRMGNRLIDMSDPQQQKIAQTDKELTFQTALSPSFAVGDPVPYNLPIEQRQAMEVRITEINLDLLRKTKVGSNTGSTPGKDNQEYLLPNSGIIYASREDALPDLSSVDVLDPKTGYRTFATMNKALSDKASATDFKLDPTRRPNGIRLIRGSNLSRQTNYRDPEKGLTLATNAPAYIKADNTNGFNLHAVPDTTNPIEEFTELRDAVSSNFYTRKTPIDTRFACRTNQTGCTGSGDQWRAARILADSISLLSNNFYDGVRSDSNFDQNNNGGNYLVEQRLKNGFFWNGFGTTSPTANVILPDATNQSSYWTNGVTPIQRRASGVTVYAMEICLKLPVVACQPKDWKRSQSVTIDGATPLNLTIEAGTTATLPTVTPSTSDRLESIYRFPRRVAFARNEDGSLLLKTPNDATGDIILGSTADNTKLVTIKTPTTATDRGTIPIPSQLPAASIFTLVPTPLTDGTTATALWFASGSQQEVTSQTPVTPALATSPLQFKAGTVPTDLVATSGTTPYYQQWVTTPTTVVTGTVTTTKGITGLPQFLAPFDSDVPGALTMAAAAKNSFCIAIPPVVVPPATTAPALALGAGRSEQIVVRTQKNSTSYLAPKTVPGTTAANLSTLPLPPVSSPAQASDMPPTAIKPFEPYGVSGAFTAFGDTPSPALFTNTAWATSPTSNPYPGIDPTGTDALPCDTAVATAIETFKDGLLTATGDIVFSDFVTTTPTTGAAYVNLTAAVATPPTPGKVTITAVSPTAAGGTRKITYIDLGTTTAAVPIPAGTEITLKKATDEFADADPIFVIRALSDEGMTIGDTTTLGNGVKLYLDGVNPNNVFWVSKRGLTIADANNSAVTATVPNPELKGHLLAGNFIGKNILIDPAPAAPATANSPLYIGDNTKVTAGRFLGFTGSNLRETRTTLVTGETAPVPPATLPGSIPPKVTMEIWAMNSLPPTYQKLTNQPIMAPILNLHSPKGTPSAPFPQNVADGLNGAGWIPQALASSFNAVLVMGDSPSRPIEPKITQYLSFGDPESAESSGGLINFPRF